MINLSNGIIKRVLLSVSVITVMVLSQAASADNRHNRRGYNSYGYGNNYSRGYSSNRYNPYHYGSRDRRSRNNFYISYGNRYDRHRRHDSGSFFGGLVLGSLLSYPSYSSRRYDNVSYRSRPVTQTREIVYVNNSSNRTSSAPVASGRRLLRDLEGNCFERVVDEEGNEVRLQLEAEECNF